MIAKSCITLFQKHMILLSYENVTTGELLGGFLFRKVVLQDGKIDSEAEALL